MISDKTKPTNLHDQLLILSKKVGVVRDVLKGKEAILPKETLDELDNLEASLSQLSKHMETFETDQSNLLELAGIGQVVNSTLDLDSVLQIVMDTIVRLTHAERGFLMLRDEQREMTIRIARNWEQESIHPNEFAISRTIMDKVIEEGKPVLTTNAQEDPRFGAQESIVAYSLRSILCVPLKIKDDLIGLIYADSPWMRRRANRIRASNK